MKAHVVVLKAAIHLQKSIRLWNEKCRVFHAFEEREIQHQASMTIQRAFRCNSMARSKMSPVRLLTMICRMQSLTRKRQERQKFSTTIKTVVFIQAIWRGLLARKTSTFCMNIIRNRLHKAASSGSKSSIGEKTTQALSVLSKGTKLTAVMKACCTLEMSTRLSENCCVTFADHGATAMIYGLIRSCNRSQPHVELVVTALSILKNLSSHESTIYALIEPKEAIEVLLETCQNFRDKQRIFALGVVLLEIIWRKMHPLINAGSRFQMKSRLEGIHQILVRKQSMEKRSRSISSSNTKNSSSRSLMRKLEALIASIDNLERGK